MAVYRKKTESERRSCCPVSCALDIFGDRWTLLLIRDLRFGPRRFKDFANSPEGIPTNILSERLNRLLANEVIHQVQSDQKSKHLAYQLTEKGLALLPLLQSIRDWGLTWEPGTRLREDVAADSSGPLTA